MPQLVAPHYLEISQRPRQGTALVGSYRASAYRHRLTTLGGYDTASCALNVKPAEAEDIFSNMVGCVAAIYVDDPTTPIWEGYIERITYRVGGSVLTRSLENMANRVRVTYYNADSGAAVKTETTPNVPGTTDNAASQAIYGLKEMDFEAGIHFNNANKTHKTILAATLAAIRPWPQVSVTSGSNSGGPLIELEMRGLHYMAWDWQVYENTDATLDAASFLLGNVTANSPSPYLPANAPYIYNTTNAIGAGLSANASFSMSRSAKSGQTYLQFIQSIVEGGNGTQQWIFGITPRDFNTGVREVYYRAANADVAYQVYALRDTGRLRDLSGAIVPGWRVTPDAGVQIMDILIGYNQAGDDPRVFYIDAIEYDGETGLVSFQTSDNITMEGVLQKNRYVKARNRAQRFGADPRYVL